jgi:hypothetical protein
MEAVTVSREYHDNNVYAHDVKNAIKHISEVVSGRKGYYCMGCQREMQAKKGDIKSHHFAHDPKDIDSKGKCTYSDETYRHKLAKEVLQMIKQIKLPALYKYPPLGEEGTPVKLRDSGTIYAHRVEIELPFFEAEDGQVKWGRKVEFSENNNRYLLIQPDVAFFDADDKPILLIEIVATHKVDTDKLSKIRRLGIDVVQITVPKDSPEEIQGAFYKTNRTKWLYSYEQETTAYIRISQGNSEGIPPLDEFQRKLLKAAESFECRASQIAGLLRAIGKSMGSEQYRIADQSVRDEIRRVERNAEGARTKLGIVQEQHKKSVADEFELQASGASDQERDIEAAEREADREYKNLERRYTIRKAQIIESRSSYRPKCQSEIDGIAARLEELGARAGTIDQRITALGAEEDGYQRDAESELSANSGFEARAREEIAKIDRRREALFNEYSELEARIRAEFEKRETEIRLQSLANESENH